MNRFAITAMGRSGTKFLAQAMNLSPTWTVLHEPGAGTRDIPSIRRRFEADFYGEVNSFLRFRFMDFEVERRGIIVRDPRAIALSAVNKGHRLNPELYNEAFKLLVEFQEAGCSVIRFERMTTDIDYLEEVFCHFGVDDVDMSMIDLTRKVNGSPGKRTWNDLTDDDRRRCEVFRWYAERHGYGW